jgi:hypothetical protein
MIPEPGRDTERLATCPECGRRNALMALGTRTEGPRHWIYWRRQLTHILVCRLCEAVIETPEPVSSAKVRLALWRFDLLRRG